MPNGTWSRLRRFGAPAVLIGTLAACGAVGAEEGLLPEGPPQGEVALDYDAATDRLLKAYPRALYESSDGGLAWQPVPLPARTQDGAIAAVVTPADSAGVLYIAGPGLGVLRSADAGQSWTRRTQGLPSEDVAAFAAHATQAGTLYAFVPEHGIFRTEDAGETWKQMDGGPGAPIRQLFHSDMKGSMQTGWLFAATPEGVRRSMDCFCGWRPTGELPAGEVFDVAYDPQQPDQVYAATREGLFRSTDGGESWEAVKTEGPIPTALAMDAAGILYAATRDGALLRSADA